MARYDHLPLFKSAYTLCLEMYKITHNFKKEYKYTLAEHIKNTSHDILDLVIETNSLRNCDKLDHLNLLLQKMEKLKMYLRISCDLKNISPALLGITSEKFEEIGKQIAGWKKWAESNKTS